MTVMVINVGSNFHHVLLLPADGWWAFMGQKVLQRSGFLISAMCLWFCAVALELCPGSLHTSLPLPPACSPGRSLRPVPWACLPHCSPLPAGCVSSELWTFHTRAEVSLGGGCSSSTGAAGQASLSPIFLPSSPSCSCEVPLKFSQFIRWEEVSVRAQLKSSAQTSVMLPLLLGGPALGFWLFNYESVNRNLNIFRLRTFDLIVKEPLPNFFDHFFSFQIRKKN